MKNTVQYGSRTIEYTLRYSKRKSLGIVVMPDMSVEVKAPLHAPIQRIQEKIRKRAPWILKQQRYFEQFHPPLPEKQYVSGETHFYLGRQYRLKVHIFSDEITIESVKLRGRFIEVQALSHERVQELVHTWYRTHAEQRLKEYTTEWVEYLQRYKLKPHTVYLRSMPKRWGSCTPKGNIILHPDLIISSRWCIDYVIVHELCHLKYKNHSTKFYSLLKRILPDWERRKECLEKS